MGHAARVKHKLTVILPWPGRVLWPNNRAHWRSKATVARAARAEGYYLTPPSPGWDWGETSEIAVTYVVHPPSKRKFDSDGIESALKPYRDGVCDRLAIDDARLWPVLKKKSTVVKGGAVHMTLEQ